MDIALTMDLLAWFKISKSKQHGMGNSINTSSFWQQFLSDNTVLSQQTARYYDECRCCSLLIKISCEEFHESSERQTTCWITSVHGQSPEDLGIQIKPPKTRRFIEDWNSNASFPIPHCKSCSGKILKKSYLLNFIREYCWGCKLYLKLAKVLLKYGMNVVSRK